MPEAKPMEVYLFPSLLRMGETIQDGPNGEVVTINETTLLLWVDLLPTHRFVHPTMTVLIGPSGAKVLNGSWWVVVNGKMRFPSNKTSVSNAVFPIKLGDTELHLLPGEIYPEDELTDGAKGKPLPIHQQSIVFWLDMQPTNRYEHPTQYIVIGAQGAEVIAGVERPTVRGNHHLLGIPTVSPTRRTLLVEPLERPVEPDIEIGGPSLVLDVVLADFARVKADPKRITLTALGRVSTLGWSNARLVPHVYIQAPPDGIWGYDFVAERPSGLAAMAIGTVTAATSMTAIDGVSGVRIHAAREDYVLRVPEVIEGSPPEGDEVSVQSCKIEGDQLVLEVQTRGDAKNHRFRLLWNGTFLESNPPQAHFRLVHNALGDKTETTSQATLRFDLIDLPRVVMHLSNAFGWSETIRYRFTTAE